MNKEKAQSERNVVEEEHKTKTATNKKKKAKRKKKIRLEFSTSRSFLLSTKTSLFCSQSGFFFFCFSYFLHYIISLMYMILSRNTFTHLVYVYLSFSLYVIRSRALFYSCVIIFLFTIRNSFLLLEGC